jgi:hypothetical protein
MIEKLLSPEVQIFIKDRQGDDPFLLSLNAKEPDDFPVREAIEQIPIASKSKAKTSVVGKDRKHHMAASSFCRAVFLGSHRKI